MAHASRIGGLVTEHNVTLGVVSGGHFISHLYLLAFPPLFPLLRPEFGLSNAELGIIVSAVSVAMLLQMPVGGLVDEIGAKWVFVGGVAVTAGGIILAGFATSYLMLLGAALLSGIGQSAFHPADFALIDAVSEESNEGKAFSLHMFGGNVGFAVAPIAIGTLGVIHGWRLALLAAGGLGLAYAIASGLILDPVYAEYTDGESDGDDESFLDGVRALFRAPILILFAFFFLYAAANFGIQGFLTVLFVESLSLNTTLGNTGLTAFFAFVSVGILIGGVLADRFEPYFVIPPAFALAAVAVWTAATGVVTGASVPAVGLFAVAGFGFGIVLPSRDRLLNILSSAGTTGQSTGFVFNGIPVAGLLVPGALGAVIDATTVSTAFAIIGGFIAAGAATALVLGVWFVPSE